MCFSNHCSSLLSYNIVISKGIFEGFAFQKVFLGGFLSVAKYFLGSSEKPNSADPCL